MSVVLVVTKKKFQFYAEKIPNCALKLTGNNEKINYTINNCANTSGLYLLPFVVYKSKRNLYQSWCKDWYILVLDGQSTHVSLNVIEI